MSAAVLKNTPTATEPKVAATAAAWRTNPVAQAFWLLRHRLHRGPDPVRAGQVRPRARRLGPLPGPRVRRRPALDRPTS